MDQEKDQKAEKPTEEPVAADQAQGEKKPRRRNVKKPKDDKETEGEAKAPVAEATPEGPAADGEKKKRVRNNRKPKDGETTDGVRPPMICFNCDKEGHGSRECTEPKRPREDRGPMKCFNCQGEGHMSRECPEPRKPREDGGKAEAAKESKYRVKGEEGEAKEGEAPTDGEAKKRIRKPKNKKENEQKDGENAENGPTEPKYRVKGEKTEGEEEEKAEKKDKKPKEKPEAKKNLIYRNPLDFKEKKKFKSKWEEYHYGDWKRGSGKTFVTLDTDIPEEPEAIPEPAESDYRKKKQDIDDRIKEINDSINDKKS